jgi:hypothetical protein
VAVVRRLLSVGLILSLLTALPLAYADPPDPTYIGGFWDDDDFDNVVEVVTALCAVPTTPIPCERPLWQAVGYAESVWREPIPGAVVRIIRTRAPPRSISLP